ncbi:MAG: exodeoxyribonuclease V subunit alpha [Bradymonadaceae bacterium]
MNETGKRLHPRGTLYRPSLDGTEGDLLDAVAALDGSTGFEAGDEELDSGLLHMARDLVLLQSGLSALEQRALFMLVLCTFTMGRRGSTRLPLDFTPGGVLEGCLSTLISAELGSTRGWGRAELLDGARWIMEQKRAPDLVGEAGDYKPLILADGHLYHHRLLHYEDHLVDALSRRLSNQFSILVAPDDPRLDEAMASILEDAPRTPRGPMKLNGEQKAGVLRALSSPMTIITGGPGTGKTSIVVSILRMLGRIGLELDDIAMAAPTGKAAHRLAESIEAQLSTLDPLPDADRTLFEAGPRARTLHRLLGYSPAQKRFYHHEGNRLPYRVVIVDEASMIDLFLMERLLNALREDTHLILLGDADQLPSVDTGAILRDLVEDIRAPTLAHTIRLMESYRMDPSQVAGRKILQLARGIGDEERSNPLGELKDSTDQSPLIAVRTRVKDLVHQGVELLEVQEEEKDGDSLSKFVDHWFETHIVGEVAGMGLEAMIDFDDAIHQSFHFRESGFDAESTGRLDELFAHFARVRMLTLTRVQSTGSERINAAFHRRMLLRKKAENTRWDFVAGEPVMMLRNDYERGLFNGDQGLILWVERAEQERADLMVVFPDKTGYRPFFLGALRPHLDHAFAMTVHKSQGSEFRHIALILPDKDISLLSREVLYTGLTRASHSVTIIGSAMLLERGSRRKLERFSGIAEKLAARHAPLSEPKPSIKVPRPVQGVLFPLD